LPRRQVLSWRRCWSHQLPSWIIVICEQQLYDCARMHLPGGASACLFRNVCRLRWRRRLFARGSSHSAELQRWYPLSGLQSCQSQLHIVRRLPVCHSDSDCDSPVSNYAAYSALSPEIGSSITVQAGMDHICVRVTAADGVAQLLYSISVQSNPAAFSSTGSDGDSSTGGTSSLQVCPAGFWCPDSAASPVPCDMGTFSQLHPIPSVCSQCPSGRSAMLRRAAVCNAQLAHNASTEDCPYLALLEVQRWQGSHHQAARSAMLVSSKMSQLSLAARSAQVGNSTTALDRPPALIVRKMEFLAAPQVWRV
jgi:hypothetical protein